MEFDIKTRGRVSVGPNGLARSVPRSARIVVTGTDPYDLDIRLSWDDDEQRLVPDDIRVTRRPDGIAVRAADLARIQTGDARPPARLPRQSHQRPLRRTQQRQRRLWQIVYGRDRPITW
jgi:hypothetical protein